jgi:hypothetical protein
MPIVYALDTTGVALANKVVGEQHTLTPSTNIHNLMVPTYAPFFADGFSISYRDLSNTVRTLVLGVDYYFTHQFVGATRAIGKPVYGSVELLNKNITGVGTLVYQTLGGQWAASANAINSALSDILRNPRTTTWEMVANVPEVFPPVPHPWDLQDLVGQSDLIASIGQISSAIAGKANGGTNITLPAFYPSKEKVGLSNVDNFKTATDVEAVAGTSPTRFISPRGVKLLVDQAIATYDQSRTARYSSAVLPGSGSYSGGDYVSCTDNTVRTWAGTPAGLVGAHYIVKGWFRLTTGATHVLGTDWAEDRSLTA